MSDDNEDILVRIKLLHLRFSKGLMIDKADDIGDTNLVHTVESERKINCERIPHFGSLA